MAKTTPKTEAKRPKKKTLERWSELELERMAAGREAGRCKKEQQSILAEAEAFYRQERPKGGALEVFGFVFSTAKKRAAVKWRDWLLTLAGPVAVAEAEESVGEREVFSITAPVSPRRA